MNVPGFELVRGWRKLAHLTEVIDAITFEQSTIRMFGRACAIPRLTSWMGSGAYTYSGIRHEPAPVPAIVEDMRYELGVRLGTLFNSVLANLYRHGNDSVAWHADDEPELGAMPVIASLSLGASRRFAVKSRATGERHDVVLEHGDLLIMSGRSQLDYLHAVPKTARPVGPRLNLTFRHVS